MSAEHYSQHESVRELIVDVVDQIGYDAFTTSVETIEHDHVPGFIPFTNGGWNGCVTFGLLNEPSERVKVIAPYADADYQEMIDTFREQQGVPDPITVEDHPDWEQFRDEWEQGDDTCWFVYARAMFYEAHNSRNVSGEDEFLFLLGVNTDFNYGRDHVSYAPSACTHWVYERNVPVTELNEDTLATIRDEMLTAWGKA